VATSLRSWALNTISAKASEYLTLLNTKIQRIQLSEKSRDISVTCYSRSEVLDLESLSGGEQVSVALALRLGMASLLGASNLNLMILDEPTMHLDAERKKSLVGVLSQLSNISESGRSMQFIIITHDSEIFEDSNVERIYKFESTENGSKITAI
jgi:exonuclease SbcC